jgi:hypothetical protein
MSEEARFPFPIRFRFVFDILNFRILESVGRGLELSTVDMEGNIMIRRTDPDRSVTTG